KIKGNGYSFTLLKICRFAKLPFGKTQRKKRSKVGGSKHEKSCVIKTFENSKRIQYRVWRGINEHAINEENNLHFLPFGTDQQRSCSPPSFHSLILFIEEEHPTLPIVKNTKEGLKNL